NEDKARRVTDQLLTLLDRIATRLLDDIRVGVKLTHVNERENGETQLIVKVSNDSRLPLRGLSFTTKPKLRYESSDLQYQLPGESDSIEFIGTLPVAEGPVTLELHWTGRNLNGTRFVGSRELSIQRCRGVTPPAIQDVDLGPSPYICGDP